jgi:hypothetical protein
MDPKTQMQIMARITEIDIGLEESSVVQVEASEATGYLIADHDHRIKWQRNGGKGMETNF